MENLEKKFSINVKYYLTTGPLNKRINEKPFFSHLDINQKQFNIYDIKELLENEKISDIYNIDSIRIQTKSDGYFENMNNLEYTCDDSQIIVLELHYNKIKKRKNFFNTYETFKKEIIQLNSKINKVSENIEEYDLIYLYASPIFIDDKGTSTTDGIISYREEINKFYNEIIYKKSY